MNFDVIGSLRESDAQVFGQTGTTSRYARGLAIPPSPFMCCGVTTLRGFGTISIPSGSSSDAFAIRAGFLAGLWRQTHGRTHYVYILNRDLLLCPEHKALLECGSVEVCVFPNLQPGHGNDLYMFVVNLNEGIGKFFDSVGNAYTKPPEQPAPAVAKTVRVKNNVLSNKTAETV